VKAQSREWLNRRDGTVAVCVAAQRKIKARNKVGAKNCRQKGARVRTPERSQHHENERYQKHGRNQMAQAERFPAFA
jgi:hypothetical protein